MRDIDKQFPYWYSEQTQSFRTQHKRFKISQSNGDIDFGVEKIRALYRDNGATIENGIAITDYLSVCDLKHLMLIPIGKVDGSNLCLQQQCWLSILSYAIGRGGEIRFLCYNDWEYHLSVEVTDITWKELKNLELYAMPVVPDLDSWLFDFYHCMGSYLCVEGGLFRSAGDIVKGLMNVIFPQLHRYNISSVTKVITNIIRDSFPYGVPDKVSFVLCPGVVLVVFLVVLLSSLLCCHHCNRYYHHISHFVIFHIVVFFLY